MQASLRCYGRYGTRRRNGVVAAYRFREPEHDSTVEMETLTSILAGSHRNLRSRELDKWARSENPVWPTGHNDIERWCRCRMGEPMMCTPQEATA